MKLSKRWANIEIPDWDSEILEIDRFEKSLGELPKEVEKIRELVTRFEVCHFKSDWHIRLIIYSLENMRSSVAPSRIGKKHISKGPGAWKNDKTGRCELAMNYIKAIRKWLRINITKKDVVRKTNEFEDNISKWLGVKNPDKIRLTKLLLARLLWDWDSYNKLQIKGEYEELEKQICRIDICHYAFPTNLDLLLKSIGEMKPAESFEGCGSFNEEIKEVVIREIKYINNYLIKWSKENKIHTQSRMYKIWILQSLKKTLTEQVNLYCRKNVIK